MPTQRFFNLKEEKRRAILEAAFHEFSRTPYSAASINRIIKEADISRGSFYTYFEDKDDLMRYLVGGFKEVCRKAILAALEECGGDPFETALALLKRVMETKDGSRSYYLYKNSLAELNVVMQNRLLGVKEFSLGDEEYRGFISELYSRVDAARFPIGGVEKMAYLVDLMLAIAAKSVSMFYMGVADEAGILDMTRNQMRILKDGALN